MKLDFEKCCTSSGIGCIVIGHVRPTVHLSVGACSQHELLLHFFLTEGV